MDCTTDYYTVVSDGGKKGDITYGSYMVYDPYGNNIHTKQLVFGYGTSNTAEYLTVLSAIRYCVSQDIKKLVVLTDSALVVNQVKGVYAINYEHLQELVDAVNKELKHFDSVKLKKVPRNIIKSHLGH